MRFQSYVKWMSKMLIEIKKGRLHLFILSSIFISIILILFLDFFNIEAFPSFNQKFMFDLTWKGRMFYLIFLVLLLFESRLGWNVILQNQRAFQNRFRIILMCIFAVIPFVYVLSVNFFGFDGMITNLGQALQIRDVNDHWPISVEYLILASLFIIIIWLTYGFVGLKSFSISLSFFVGVGIIYLVDTIWPFGTLELMELLAVPTAACATVLLDLLGYRVSLRFPFVSTQEYGSLPRIQVWNGGNSAIADIAWVCAGVHSLFFYTIIILIFFRRLSAPRERKIIYFLVGAAGTYFINILRIASYLIISVHYGSQVGWVFHNSYGELYFFAWMLSYFVIIAAIQSGKIKNVTGAIRKRLQEGF